MKVQVGVSNRHIHLTKEHYEILVGDKKLEKLRDIKQPGQYATTDVFTIKTDKDKIDNVRLLGPFRDYSQVEISKTDAYKLGINPPIRESGDIKGSSPITIIGPCGSVELKEGCILANRHIHVDDKILKYYKLEGKDKVSILVKGEKSGILSDVYLKHSDEAYFELHLDTDDANAFLLKNGDIVDIIK